MVDEIVLTVLIENSVDSSDETKQRLIAKHGLSILVETRTDKISTRILLDTGPSPEAIMNNIDILGVNLGKIDAILLSHGHSDHTSGLLTLLKNIGKPVPVLMHPKIFNPKFGFAHKLIPIGPRFTLLSLEDSSAIPVIVSNPVMIADDVTTTGEIARTTTYEQPPPFYKADEGQFMRDSIIDDQALVLNLKAKGLVIVTGCAHSGIVNTVWHSQKMMKTEKIHAVMGGFHLFDSKAPRIRATLNDLKKFNPEVIAPCHCTGKKATTEIRKMFKDKCRPLSTGDIMKL